MTTGELTPLTDQALVTQLAHIQDVIGITPTFLPAAEGPELLDGALLDLLAQEVNILDELRARLVNSDAMSSVVHRPGAVWPSSMERICVRSAGLALRET